MNKATLLGALTFVAGAVSADVDYSRWFPMQPVDVAAKTAWICEEVFYTQTDVRVGLFAQHAGSRDSNLGGEATVDRSDQPWVFYLAVDGDTLVVKDDLAYMDERLKIVARSDGALSAVRLKRRPTVEVQIVQLSLTDGSMMWIRNTGPQDLLGYQTKTFVFKCR